VEALEKISCVCLIKHNQQGSQVWTVLRVLIILKQNVPCLPRRRLAEHTATIEINVIQLKHKQI
jgi:hypothetical protein